eukprot:6180316-Pleurochrysis_carterae.AAC.3
MAGREQSSLSSNSRVAFDLIPVKGNGFETTISGEGIGISGKMQQFDAYNQRLPKLCLNRISTVVINSHPLLSILSLVAILTLPWLAVLIVLRATANFAGQHLLSVKARI